MFKRFVDLSRYPAQFRLMFWGMLLSTLGASMIWPFLMIYVSQKLALPLTTATSLLSINALVGLLSSLVAGAVADRVGRKGVMVIGLAANGLVYLFLSQASTYGQFALLMGLSGAANPLYRVGSDAMLADLIPPANRPSAYAMLRLSNNLGISVGPAIGGMLAVNSYTLAFIMAAAGMIAYSLLLIVLAKETLPTLSDKPSQPQEVLGGYGKVLADKPFVAFSLTAVLVQMCAVLIFVLMPVYANGVFNIPESRYSLIPTTNALMVVFLQVGITAWTRRAPPLAMCSLGALLYGLGVGSIALLPGLFGLSPLWGFWLSMVIMTLGELVFVPTASTQVANMAPADRRGRYMSLFGLTWNAASAIAPVAGGVLNDTLNPQAPYLGGLAAGLAAALFFWLMARRQ